MTTTLAAQDRPLQALYFFFYIWTSSIGPFLPIYFSTYLKLSPQDIGILQGITPVMIILAAPMWGLMADWSGRRHDVLLITFLGSTFCRMGLFLPSFWNDDGVPPNVTQLLGVVVVMSFFYAPVKSLVDSTALAQVSGGNGSSSSARYGRCRLWGQIGTGVSSALVGASIYSTCLFASVLHTVSAVLVTVCLLRLKRAYNENANEHGDEGERNDGNPVCVTHQTTISGQRPSSCPAGLSPQTTKVKSPSPSHVLTAMVHTEGAAAFFALVLIIGVAFGFIETFCYVRLSQSLASSHPDINSSAALATCRACLALCGTVMYYYLPCILKRLSVYKVCYLTIFLCGAMCQFYSEGSILNVVVAEAMRGGTFALFWSGCTLHVNTLKGRGGRGNMLQTMLECTYRGIGYSVGSIMGGKVSHKLGSMSLTFDLFGRVLVCLSLVLQFAHEWCVWRAAKQVELFKEAAKKDT